MINDPKSTTTAEIYNRQVEAIRLKETFGDRYRLAAIGRLPTEAILHPLTPFRSLAVGQARKTPLKIERQLQCFWVVS